MKDLHIHTIYSDGEHSPNEIIEYCINNNIDTISFTDHDNISSYNNIDLKYINDNRIKIVPGIEMTAKVDVGQMHILGYYIDIKNEELNDIIKELNIRSLYHVIGILNEIKNDYNITFDREDLKSLFNKNSNLGRPDIAKLCIKYGYSKTVKEAFDKYLINAYEKIRNKNTKGLYYEECFKYIKNANGLVGLAHPKTLKLNDNELFNLLKEMKTKGLDFIECYHSTFTKEETEKYIKMAKKLNLLISGGSDYHGEIIKPDIKIGTGKNENLNIKKLTILN